MALLFLRNDYDNQSVIIVFADVIVCVFIIIWIMKLLKRRKDGRR